MYRAMHMRRAVKMFGVDSRAMSAAVVDLAETNSLSRSNHLICLRALRNELSWRDREVRRCAFQLSSWLRLNTKHHQQLNRLCWARDAEYSNHPKDVIRGANLWTPCSGARRCIRTTSQRLSMQVDRNYDRRAQRRTRRGLGGGL